MHGEAQCMPLVPLSEQCHALNSTMLVVFACSRVSKGGEVLCEVLGFCAFCFRVCMFYSSSLLFMCVHFCSCLSLFLCVKVLRAKIDKVQHAPLVISSEQYHALDLALLVFSTCSCVYHGLEWFVRF
jgi:hypothetical protein